VRWDILAFRVRRGGWAPVQPGALSSLGSGSAGIRLGVRNVRPRGHESVGRVGELLRGGPAFTTRTYMSYTNELGKAHKTFHPATAGPGFYDSHVRTYSVPDPRMPQK